MSCESTNQNNNSNQESKQEEITKQENSQVESSSNEEATTTTASNPNKSVPEIVDAQQNMDSKSSSKSDVVTSVSSPIKNNNNVQVVNSSVASKAQGSNSMTNSAQTQLVVVSQGPTTSLNMSSSGNFTSYVSNAPISVQPSMQQQQQQMSQMSAGQPAMGQQLPQLAPQQQPIQIMPSAQFLQSQPMYIQSPTMFTGSQNLIAIQHPFLTQNGVQLQLPQQQQIVTTGNKLPMPKNYNSNNMKQGLNSGNNMTTQQLRPIVPQQSFNNMNQQPLFLTSPITNQTFQFASPTTQFVQNRNSNDKNKLILQKNQAILPSVSTGNTLIRPMQPQIIGQNFLGQQILQPFSQFPGLTSWNGQQIFNPSQLQSPTQLFYRPGSDQLYMNQLQQPQMAGNQPTMQFVNPNTFNSPQIVPQSVANTMSNTSMNVTQPNSSPQAAQNMTPTTVANNNSNINTSTPSTPQKLKPIQPARPASNDKISVNNNMNVAQMANQAASVTKPNDNMVKNTSGSNSKTKANSKSTAALNTITKSASGQVTKGPIVQQSNSPTVQNMKQELDAKSTVPPKVTTETPKQKSKQDKDVQVKTNETPKVTSSSTKSKPTAVMNDPNAIQKPPYKRSEPIARMEDVLAKGSVPPPKSMANLSSGKQSKQSLQSSENSKPKNRESTVPVAVNSPALRNGNRVNAASATNGNSGHVKESKPVTRAAKAKGPEVLRHVIENYVIEESSHPFPVDGRTLTPEKTIHMNGKSNGIVENGDMNNYVNSTRTMLPSPINSDSSSSSSKVQTNGSRARGASDADKCQSCNKPVTKSRLKIKNNLKVCPACFNKKNKPLDLFNPVTNPGLSEYDFKAENPSGQKNEPLLEPMTGPSAPKKMKASRKQVAVNHNSSNCETMNNSVTASQTPSPIRTPSNPVQNVSMSSTPPTPSGLFIPESGTDLQKWNVQDVYDFVRNLGGCEEHADEFKSQEIDGQALLLLKEDHLVNAMHMKLGPALKLFNKIKDIRSIDQK